MKTKLLIILCISTLLGFTQITEEQEYTYLLTITSLDNVEHSFDLKISSIDNTKNKVEIELKNQTTPFEKKLEKGQHAVLVNHSAKKGSVQTKIVGIVNGKTKGYISTDESSGETLTVGPGGRYRAF